MSAHDARGDDVIAYYASTIGFTRALGVSAISAQVPDEQGPLEPGRWLLQLLDRQSAATRAWLAFGPFRRGEPLVAVVGPPYFPMSGRGLIALEFNVRRGDNDRVAAVAENGTATLYLTRLSRSE